MRHISFTLLEKFLSTERLSTYLHLAKGNKEEAADLYIENLNQCRIYHTRLHWLEVGLRNAMNGQLSNRYGEDWYDNPSMGLEAIERQQVQKAKETLLRERKSLNKARVVAALNFGFWVNLYNNPYEEIWRKCLINSFPYRLGRLTRKQLREKLRPLLKLRNRIAHYEPILELNFTKMHVDMLDIVHWINPNITVL